MITGVLHNIAALIDTAPSSRKRVFAAVLEDPERVLGESFETLANRVDCSVPTIMRACRDIGFAGLREFKMALAQELAVRGSPLHRQVQMHDSVQQVVSKVSQSAAAVVSSLNAQMDATKLEAAAQAMIAAPRVDCYSVGVTSSFLASEMQSRLFRLGLVSNACLDLHLQLVSAATMARTGVVFAISHVGGMPSLLEAIGVARSQGATVIALTQPGTPLAQSADLVLSISVPDDPVMQVGTEVYLAHMTVIEILTVLVAQRLGVQAVQRLGGVRDVLGKQGVDMRHDPVLNW